MIDFNKELYQWGPVDASIILMSYPAIAFFKPAFEKHGYCYSECYILFKGSKVTWALDRKYFLRVCQKFTEEWILNDSKRLKFEQDFSEATNKLYSTFKRINERKLGALNNQELKTFFEEFSAVYVDYWATAGLVLFVNEALDKSLKSELSKIISDENEFSKVFVTLSSPADLTFYRQEEKELIEIIKMPEDRQDGALLKHARKYFWIYNSYLESKILDKEFFAHELNKLKSSDYEKIYESIVNYVHESRKEKEKLILKHGFNDDVKRIIGLLEKYIIMQDVRKKDNFLADHYIDMILKEISRRKEIDLVDLRYLFPSEVSKIIISEIYEQYRDTIDERKRGAVAVYSDYLNKKSWNILDKKKLKEVMFKMEKSVINKKQVNLQGVVASTGESKYFRGRVKIVLSSEEIDKLEDGEILVTTMTAPDYIVGMRKAGAIITDEGGITCHAAVVSRELNKSCIVGTKIATKILKDGDIVEIHGGRGVVRIIKA